MQNENSHAPDKHWGYGCFWLYKMSKMGFYQKRCINASTFLRFLQVFLRFFRVFTRFPHFLPSSVHGHFFLPFSALSSPDDRSPYISGGNLPRHARFPTHGFRRDAVSLIFTISPTSYTILYVSCLPETCLLKRSLISYKFFTLHIFSAC